MPALQARRKARKARQQEAQEEMPPEHTLISEPPLQLLVTVDEMARMLSIGRSLAWKLVMSKCVDSVHVGRWRRIPVKSIHDYVDSLMASAS